MDIKTLHNQRNDRNFVNDWKEFAGWNSVLLPAIGTLRLDLQEQLIKAARNPDHETAWLAGRIQGIDDILDLFESIERIGTKANEKILASQHTPA